MFSSGQEHSGSPEQRRIQVIKEAVVAGDVNLYLLYVFVMVRVRLVSRVRRFGCS